MLKDHKYMLGKEKRPQIKVGNKVLKIGRSSAEKGESPAA